jgi:spoIIIJ-associated protein
MDKQYKASVLEILTSLIDPVLGHTDYEIDICKEADQWRINVDGDSLDAIIGEGAEVLRALQHILRVKVHKQYPKDRTHFILDIGKYRHDREVVLKSRARLIAEAEVLKNGSTLILVGLSSYERRIIHNLLVEIEGLETTSVGQGSSRKLLIRPTSEIGAKSMDAARVIDLFSDKSELKA